MTVNMDALGEYLDLGKGKYEFEYYSPSQVSVYFGDIWVDEVVAIQYNYQHEKHPIYGYASSTWDTVADGRKSVQGQLAINFKETAYLQLILQYMNSRGAIYDPNDKDGKVEIRRNVENYLREVNNTVHSEKLRELEIYEQLYGSLDPAENDPKYNQFSALSEALEDQIWGKGDKDEDSGLILTNPTNMDPFDIVITYGDMTNPNSNHTSKRISAVHLNGQSQSIVMNGEPIAEVYPFIAKNVDKIR